MMLIDNKYNFGDTVYLTTDKEQLPRVIICIQVYNKGELVYEVVSGTSKSYHYDFEMTTEKVFIP